MTEHPGSLADIIAHPEDDTPRLIYADWLDDHGQSERAEFIRLQCSIAIDEHALASGSMPPVLALEFWSGGMEQRLAVHQKNVRKQLEIDRRRERELYNATSPGEAFLNGIKWSEPFGELLRLPGVRVPLEDFRRGFVAAVICTLADWCGKECRTCHGSGSRGGNIRGCIACHGVGRIGGHGPALVRAAPLERVTLSDRQPNELYGESAACLTWARSPLQGSPNGLLGGNPD